MQATRQQPVSAQRKQELLARLLAEQGYATPRKEGIAPRPRGENPPLSFAQERMWFLQQLDPASGFYNIHAALRLSGDLDPAALGRSIAEIARRHEVLRSRVEIADGRPVQCIDPEPAGTIPVDDLTGLDGTAREAETRRLARANACRPFDLATEPPLRARLLVLEAREHVLLLALHHIAGDGWSNGIMIRELAALYPAFREGRPSPLPELPIQYADYAAWQRRRLNPETLAAPLAYWRAKLAHAPALSALPTDRPRPAVQTYRGAVHRFGVPAALASDLRRLSRERGATLFMVLLAAFKVLVLRYGGQCDLCIGTLVANRERTDIEGLIGFFANTLALRTDLSGDPGFPALLERVRRTVLEAQSHQEVPFEKLVEALNPQRHAGYGPLFQLACILQNASGEKLELPGLRVTSLQDSEQTARFDLTLELSESSDGLDARLDYNTDLFEAETVSRLAERFLALLEGIAAHPEARLSELPPMTAPGSGPAAPEYPGRGEAAGLPLAARDGLGPPRPAYLAPRTPVEEKLAGIWTDLLGVDRVGVLDDFFEIGGHSLLLAQLLIRLRQAFDGSPSLGVLFEASTVERQARLLEAGAPPAAGAGTSSGAACPNPPRATTAGFPDGQAPTVSSARKPESAPLKT